MEEIVQCIASHPQIVNNIRVFGSFSASMLSFISIFMGIYLGIAIRKSEELLLGTVNEEQKFIYKKILKLHFIFLISIIFLSIIATISLESNIFYLWVN